MVYLTINPQKVEEIKRYSTEFKEHLGKETLEDALLYEKMLDVVISYDRLFEDCSFSNKNPADLVVLHRHDSSYYNLLQDRNILFDDKLELLSDADNIVIENVFPLLDEVFETNKVELKMKSEIRGIA